MRHPPTALRGARAVPADIGLLALVVVLSLQEPPARVDGTVRSGEDRAPVAGALVTLDPIGLQALTDSSGVLGGGIAECGAVWVRTGGEAEVGDSLPAAEPRPSGRG